MITRKCAPAFAAGCTVVLKPSELTPFSALALAKLAEEAGFPKGVFNVVTGDAKPIGQTLCEDARVRKISFTGSTRIGQLLMAQSADTVKRLSLELGGNAPVIVFEDANLDKALAGVMASKFRNSGQTCVCANRILVHKNILPAFSQHLVKAVAQLKIGDALRDKNTQIGPLINQMGFDKVQRLVKDALDKGAKCLIGGKPSSLGGFFYEPTVLVNAHKDMAICQEEIFGPVVVLYAFENDEEAIAMANDTRAGLAAYIFTENAKRVWKVSEEIQAGMVAINTGVFSNAMLPFGGVKYSGFGREGSKYGIEEFLQIKNMCWDFS
jgi:succinate-semialdehyde dehydrogenase/glutarate-semialdehyde dehydrogenase